MHRVQFVSIVLATALSCGSYGARAALMSFDGEIRLDFVDGVLPALVVTGSGVADVNSGAASPVLNTLALDGGITGSTLVPVTDPAVPSTLVEVELNARLETGTLAPFRSVSSGAPLLTQNRVPVSGALRLCLLIPGCGNALDLPLSAASAGLGVGGLVAFGNGASQVSISYAPWTVGTAWVPLQTTGGRTAQVPTFGSAHGPLSLTGSTAVPGGRVRLVSPVVISSPLIGSQPISGVGHLSIRFVPEPDLALLIGFGTLALVLIGRNRVQPGRKQ